MGRTDAAAKRLLEDARALEQAGAYAIVLEGVPSEVARRITESVSVPTIGIGAGPHCDGQVLVCYDFLGMYRELSPKFVKRFAELGNIAVDATERYVTEVRSGTFPGPEHGFSMSKEEAKKGETVGVYGPSAAGAGTMTTGGTTERPIRCDWKVSARLAAGASSLSMRRLSLQWTRMVLYDIAISITRREAFLSNS